jgi:hypothetical protein
MSGTTKIRRRSFLGAIATLPVIGRFFRPRSEFVISLASLSTAAGRESATVYNDTQYVTMTAKFTTGTGSHDLWLLCDPTAPHGVLMVAVPEGEEPTT